MSNTSDYSELLLFAQASLTACYTAAQEHQYAEAIRLAFDAQDACTRAAEALEQLRVQDDRRRRVAL